MRAALTAILLTLAAPAAATTLTVNLQPVSLCTGPVEDDSCGTVTLDSAYLNEIYGQIGISVNVRDPFAALSFPDVREPDDEINAALSLSYFAGGLLGAGIDPNTIYVGFLGDLSDSTIGLAFLGAPSLPFAIVQDTFSDQVGTQIVAHEIGHVLGGEHEDATQPGQMMFDMLDIAAADAPGVLPAISDANAAAIRSSALLTPIPVPPALPLLATGAFALAVLRRTRKT